MITNDAGRMLIMRWETLQLKAYLCPAGIPTVGYGHTEGVVMGRRAITAHEAEVMLEYDLQVAESAVGRFAKRPSGNQFSALVSFVFNLGETNFTKSTLLKRHNAGQPLNAAAEFDKWVKAKDPKTGALVTLPGLVKRRAQEKALYLQADN